MNIKCEECLRKSFTGLLNNKVEKNLRKKIFKEIDNYIARVDSEIIVPEVARGIHTIIAELIDSTDLYYEEKRKSNDLALSLYEELRSLIKKSKNPFDTSLRLSIAGNIMDFAACPDFFTDSLNYFRSTINQALNSPFIIDDSGVLEEKIKISKTLLFLGDNAGEIVLDKLFLETINHPEVYYAVKGKPVLNDSTLSEADYVEMNKVAKVISNGYNAPSTILEKASPEFLDVWNKADLIISKGQGNLEGLMNCFYEDLFFLMIVKCDVIAEKLNIDKGSFVIMKNKLFEDY